MDKKNSAIVRQQFAQCVFTHKVQEVATERNEKYVFYIKLGNILLVSAVIIFLVLQIYFQENIVFSFIATGISVAEIIFLIIQLNFGFDEKVLSHKAAALKYLGLRDKYKNFIADILNENLSDEMKTVKRDFLQSEYQIISEISPQTNNEDYNKAQVKLFGESKEGEEFTWSEDEIDRFLPVNLKLNKND